MDVDEGPFKLSAGGGILTMGNEHGALESEYESIYRDFAALIARGAVRGSRPATAARVGRHFSIRKNG